MRKKNKNDAEGARGFVCPVGEFFLKMDRLRMRDSDFSDHLARSGLEFLRAMRSLVDEGIQRLERKGDGTARSKATKIKVE